ncbi:SAF domain-containing protein [Actinopolymorpha alba]|uniref:SAF domain-containing protein n=1 Tax=Actinopolymorpha alba TaxID=533267 RepID=UPI0003727BCA|nr:SAF domain-containing protein [Actinopolymorpha alba]
MSTWRGLSRDLMRAVSWHRRLLAAALAAASVAVGLHLLQPNPAPTVLVLAAARDLPGGAALTRSDVRQVALPRDVVPRGVLRPGDPLATRTLAGPVRAGEPLTDARMLSPSLLAHLSEGKDTPDDLVAAPVRIADAETVGMVRVGDRIDVLAAHTGVETASRPAELIARAVEVVSLPGRHEPSDAAAGGLPDLDELGSISGDGASGDGGLVVVAVPATVAADLARATVTSRLSLVLRPSD